MNTGSTSSDGGRSSSAAPADPDVFPSTPSVAEALSGRRSVCKRTGDTPVPIRDLFSFGSTKPRPSVHEYSLGEEVANSASHGVGALLSIAAMVLCIVFAMRDGGGVLLAAALIYSIPMFLEYVMSTLYHAITAERAKRVFKVLDHSFIYLYIAGSYTPFCLVTLADHHGAALCGVVWALALAGVAVEAFWTYRPRWISALIYLALGWCVVAFLPALIAEFPTPGFVLLLAGGLCFSLGCVFYLMKQTPYMHFVFHLLVVAGSVLQFLAILLYVL